MKQEKTELMESLDKSFIGMRDTEIRLYIDKISKDLEMHTSPLGLLAEELSHVENELSLAYNSNIGLNAVFHALLDQATRNRNLDHLTLCEEYCRQNQLSQAESQYFIKIFSLYGIRKWLNSTDAEMRAEIKARDEEAQELVKGEFTPTRRILAIILLLKAAGEKINYGQGEQGVNKRKITAFIDFLTSSEMQPVDIRDSHPYARVKTLWDSADKVMRENLLYVRAQFANIGLTNIVAELDKIIDSQITTKK